MKTKEELGDSLCKYCYLERKGAYNNNNNNGGSVAFELSKNNIPHDLITF